MSAYANADGKVLGGVGRRSFGSARQQSAAVASRSPARSVGLNVLASAVCPVLGGVQVLVSEPGAG